MYNHLQSLRQFGLSLWASDGWLCQRQPLLCDPCHSLKVEGHVKYGEVSFSVREAHAWGLGLKTSIEGRQWLHFLLHGLDFLLGETGALKDHLNICPALRRFRAISFCFFSMPPCPAYPTTAPPALLNFSSSIQHRRVSTASLVTGTRFSHSPMLRPPAGPMCLSTTLSSIYA